jgi:hypothetical protein
MFIGKQTATSWSELKLKWIVNAFVWKQTDWTLCQHCLINSVTYWNKRLTKLTESVSLSRWQTVLRTNTLTLLSRMSKSLADLTACWQTHTLNDYPTACQPAPLTDRIPDSLTDWPTDRPFQWQCQILAQCISAITRPVKPNSLSLSIFEGGAREKQSFVISLLVFGLPASLVWCIRRQENIVAYKLHDSMQRISGNNNNSNNNNNNNNNNLSSVFTMPGPTFRLTLGVTVVALGYLARQWKYHWMEKASCTPLEYWYDTPVEWSQKLRNNCQKDRDKQR